MTADMTRHTNNIFLLSHAAVMLRSTPNCQLSE